MKNEIVQFNANRNALVIPANISVILKSKPSDGKTFEGGDFAIHTFRAFAEQMGVEKPIKGGDRTEWNECKRIYNDAKTSASQWFRDHAALAVADRSLTGKKMSVKVFRGKNGAIRRQVSFTLADPTFSEQKATPKMSRTQLEAAAKQLGFTLVAQEELALS